jgi:hypothetical protein
VKKRGLSKLIDGQNGKWSLERKHLKNNIKIKTNKK